MQYANIIVSSCAALLLFVVAGGLMFTAAASLIWSFGFSPSVSYVAGAAMGILTGGLVATPLIQRVRRLSGS
jgi:hypothetical protein